MSQSNDVIEQKGPNQIVRIRSDSESNLDDLFKTVLQPKDSQVPLSLPMRLRNLPPSFFKQPERGSKSASHSRGSSADSTFSPPAPSRPPSTTALPIHHPRAHSSPASLQQTCQPSSANLTNELPLPPGWDMGKTATGQRYFINHATQTTTWQDPRQPSNTGASGADLGPLPDGWEQATTPDGETYFINHVDQTTSWADPRIPYSPGTTGAVRAALQLQRSRGGTGSTGGLNRAGIHPPPPMVGSTTQNMLSNSQTFQLHQQKLRIQKLQMERERLRNRNKEILGQQSCVNNELLMGRSSIITEESAGSPTEDPFLSGDFHSRQESGDSGLGLGSNYSLPHTPEDFLATMDDVSMDTETMDSEDLVPSLQEQLNEDILSDVEAILGGSNQDNVLTWL